MKERRGRLLSHFLVRDIIMKWLNQFSLVIRSNLSTLCERFEDPERMLHQLLIDMEHELERVREAVAGAIADEIQLGKQLKKARETSVKWQDRAEAAIKRSDEATAREALEQKMRSDERADELEAEHESQKKETEKLRRSVQDLEQKIRQARQKQTLLLARMARANSSQRINKALHSATSRSAFAQFDRLEKRAERDEAMDEAYRRLDGEDPDADDLKDRLEEEERREKIEAELESLRSKLS